MSTGKNAGTLVVVKSAAEIRRNIRTFNNEAANHPNLSRSLLRTTQYWVYDPGLDQFGPCKFIGYSGMDFELYETAKRKTFGSKFNADTTQRAIATVLNKGFNKETALESALMDWSQRVCGSGILDGVDHEKWHFIELPVFQRRYWAVLCDPTRYDIERAVEVLDEDTWNLPAGDPEIGDRLIIWKTKGGGQKRGIVALGEVTHTAEVLSPEPESHPFWVNEPEFEPKRRIRLRYVLPPKLPLWLTSDTLEVLEGLTVANGRGTRLFNVSAEQWNQVLEALDGWPESVSIQRESVAAAQEVANAVLSGQGFCTSQEKRVAIERHAMSIAVKHFEGAGFTCLDTSANKPYDLVVTQGMERLFVEIKGTTGSGDQVFLTKNEVAHAKANPSHSVLFILSDIVLDESDGQPVASDGTIHIVWPWTPDDKDLEAITYQYRIPKTDLEG